jgi:hypothetical protein
MLPEFEATLAALAGVYQNERRTCLSRVGQCRSKTHTHPTPMTQRELTREEQARSASMESSG